MCWSPTQRAENNFYALCRWWITITHACKYEACCNIMETVERITTKESPAFLKGHFLCLFRFCFETFLQTFRFCGEKQDEHQVITTQSVKVIFSSSHGRSAHLHISYNQRFHVCHITWLNLCHEAFCCCCTCYAARHVGRANLL